MRYKKNYILAIVLSTSIIISAFIIYTFPIPESVKKEEKSREESVRPKGVRLTLIHNPNESIVITWYTKAEADDPIVEYSIDDDLLDSESVEPDVEKLEYISEDSQEPILYVSCYIYTAELTDLMPDTSYYYQISSDDDNQGEIMKFTTFPNNIEELKILVISDPQTNDYSGNIDFFLDIIEDEDFDFYIHLGDVVKNGENQVHWNKYFKHLELLNAYKPGFYVEGNHDSREGSTLMYDNIPTLDFSYFYYFETFLFLLGLNTEDERVNSESFINSSLKQANETNVKWKISFLYKPIYSSRVKREDENVKWTEYFMNYSVDVIMYGHNHYCERQYVNNSHYILCPPIGDYKKESDDFEPRAFTQVIESIFGFMMININQTTLSLKTWGYEDEIEEFRQYDNLLITR